MRLSPSGNRRFEDPNGIRFLTFGCDSRLPLLADPWTADMVVDHLAQTRSRLGCWLFAWVLMPDHVHLLLAPDHSVASSQRILLALKTRTATKALARLRGCGAAPRAFWQAGGGYDRNVWSEHEFSEKLSYIEQNPVRAGLVERPQDYRWSSAGSKAIERDVW